MSGPARTKTIARATLRAVAASTALLLTHAAEPAAAQPRAVLGEVSLPPSPAAAARPPSVQPLVVHGEAHPSPSAAYVWVDIILEAIAREVDRSSARPTIISRQVAIPVTAMFDAWAAYDARAVGTQLGGALRRPAAERTDVHKARAMAYAAYRCLLDLFPTDAPWIRAQMSAQGHDPDDGSTDLTTPQGIGNRVAQALLEARHHDGANQLGDEVGAPDHTPYGDYTFYEPVNKARVIDPDRWQPIPFSDGKGGTRTPGFLTPHWYRVRPFALARADQFRPGPPPKMGSEQLRREVDECLAYNADLSLQQKSIVELMRDGPRSTGQSGHWLRFAQDVSRRDHLGLDDDIKLCFAVANVAFDAFIAAWDAKRAYDSSRPWTLVRWYYKGQQVKGWGGPCKGVVILPADEWHPYSPFTFVTPPFPGYVSGHSTVSAAAAATLALFTGSDHFGCVARRRAGSLTEPRCEVGVMQAREGILSGEPDARADTELALPTFSATAEMAGISRVMGGYHIQADNVAGLELGRKVAAYDWPRIRAWIDGTAPTPASAGVGPERGAQGRGPAR